MILIKIIASSLCCARSGLLLTTILLKLCELTFCN